MSKQTTKTNVLKPYFLPILCIGAFIACFYPGLKMLLYKWSISEDYTHAFFIVPIIFYMIWQKKDVLTRYESSIIGFILVFLSIAGYLVSLQIRVPAVMIVTTIAFAISCLIYIGGISVLKDLAIPVFLMILIIPIPLQFLTVVTGKLQLWVSDTGAEILQLSIPVFQEGNMLHTPDRSFEVIEACSGIRSLISMATTSLILSYYTLVRNRSIIMLFALSVPIALFLNLLRIYSMVMVFYYFNIDITVGTPHTIAGLFLFGFGLVLLFIFQKILARWER